ncbi:hypothetical protein SteCoe_22549 [Stentor coeruleus]|uniref:Uncharacterized protein n=1 Tax=Stentor coeruleus TaxID=5963 RepID=A0A1R2BLU5_9CILI|nr:hypothetical protein SteCoe_22549 [Stentor coeruleus]
MRETWFGNGNKAFPWDETGLFTFTPKHNVKKDILEEKYSGQWRGMLLVSTTERKSKSPIDRERHGSSSGRTMEPSLQEIPTKLSAKKIIRQEIKKINERSGPHGNYEINGTRQQKNSTSLINPLVTENIGSAYKAIRVTTPDKNNRTGSAKRRFPESETHRLGNLDAEKPKTPIAQRVKPDFVSQISYLPGTVRADAPRTPPPRRDTYLAKQMNQTESAQIKPGKQRTDYGHEQWRSSLDIIMNVVKNKNNV